MTATATPPEACSDVFFQCRLRDLDAFTIADDAMALRASDAARDVLAMGKLHQPVCLPSGGQFCAAAAGGVTLTAAATWRFLSGFDEIGRLVTDVALPVTRERPHRALDRVTLSTVCTALTANVSRVRLVRKLQPERLSGRKSLHRWFDRGNSIVTVRTNSKRCGREFLNVTGYARPMTGDHRFHLIGPAYVTGIAFYLRVL
jgi:hypothetical protein